MNQFDRNTAWGSILHIGAGDCPELEAYLASQAQRIILVEPEPERAAMLERRTAGDARTSVIAAALAAETGEGELKIYNIRSVDGLRQPEGLEEIYPGLRLRERVTVPLISPERLFELAGPLPAPLLVIMEAPGLEADIFKAWQGSEGLPSIDRLVLHCSAMKAFEGGSDAGSLRNQLKDLAFEEVATDFSDPDWPVLVLKQDLMRLEVEAQREALAELAASLASTKAELEAAQKQGTAQGSQITELEAALAKAESDRQAALAEREAALAKAESEKQAALAEREVALAKAESDRQAALAELEARTKELREQLAQADASRTSELKGLKDELTVARSDLAVALRTQAILQTDLRDLQTRYQESSRTRVQQEELLRKLTPRLQDAARQIQEMSALQSHEARGLEGAKPARPRARKPEALPGK